MANKLYQMTPKEIVGELDKYIIGQDDAKKSVAIALRNRYRRSLLPDKMREEITPKNILMMGPTGCGKTEIARRLAKLMKAPFVSFQCLNIGMFPWVMICVPDGYQFLPWTVTSGSSTMETEQPTGTATSLNSCLP